MTCHLPQSKLQHTYLDYPTSHFPRLFQPYYVIVVHTIACLIASPFHTNVSIWVLPHFISTTLLLKIGASMVTWFCLVGGGHFRASDPLVPTVQLRTLLLWVFPMQVWLFRKLGSVSRDLWWALTLRRSTMKGCRWILLSLHHPFGDIYIDLRVAIYLNRYRISQRPH